MMRTVQWLNENQYRRYPIVEDADMRLASVADPTTFFALPDDVFLDLQLVSYTQRDGLLYLQQIDVSATDVVVTIRYQQRGAMTMEDFQVLLPAAPAVPYRTRTSSSTYSLALVLGEGVNTLAQWPVGVYRPARVIEFEPALLVYQGRHRVITLQGTAAGSVPVAGDVYFEEGYNVQIRVEPATRIVRVVPVVGAGAGFPCQRLEPLRPFCDAVLLLLNGTYADGHGNFQLHGGRGVEIIPVPAEHEVRIRTATEPADIDCGGQLA